MVGEKWERLEQVGQMSIFSVESHKNSRNIPEENVKFVENRPQTRGKQPESAVSQNRSCFAGKFNLKGRKGEFRFCFNALERINKE